jgi:NitT/TauT family transport system ATP-binding protein
VVSERFEPFSSKSPIACRRLGKVWNAGTARAHEALRGVDLEISESEFVVLLGPSGCGKSTLLYLLAGLEEASSGQSWFFGEKIEGPSPERSLIFQDTSLFPWLSVWQNVSFGLSIRGVDIAERKAIAQQALQRVGLSEVAGKRPDELSGGMRQRVAVARALAMRPKVLLMDEPFAAVDVQTRAKMQNFLIDVWRDSGASVLFVTHHIDEAVALADRVVVFTARPGRIKRIIPIALPRPRSLFSPQAERVRLDLTELLQDEVERAFAEQEAFTAARDHRKRKLKCLLR